MKARYCDREQAVVAALRSGPLRGALLDHVASCPVCSDVLFVARFLREESAHLEREAHTVDAAVVWQKAQARATEWALAKATLPIRIVRNCAFALAILASPWLVFEFSQFPAWMPDFGLRHLASMDGNWFAALTGTTLAGITATLVCVGLSSWYMLREE
jgi:hypothetical protein